MRKYSDVISWIVVLLGLGLLSTIASSITSIYAVVGLILFSIGMYRIINNSKRKEMLAMFFNIEQLPEDKRRSTIDDLIKKTRPETWHWKLIIFLLLFVIFALLYFIAYTYFEIHITIRPRGITLR